MNYKGFQIQKVDNNYYDVLDEHGKLEFAMRAPLNEVQKEVDKLARASPNRPYRLLLKGVETTLPISEREMAEEPIDSEILGLIAELNSKGFGTVASCAGHALSGGELPYGLIVFSRKLTPSEVSVVKKIAQDYGLSQIRIAHRNYGNFASEARPKPRGFKTGLTFEALGK